MIRSFARRGINQLHLLLKSRKTPNMSKGGYTPYPVVDADPSIGTSVMNFSLGEMMTIPVFTGGSMAYGYFLCKPSYDLLRHI